MEVRHYINILLRWWWLIAASVLVAGVSSYYATKAIPPTYQSKTTLMVGQVLRDPDPNQATFYTGQVLAQSYADLARREPVLKGTLQALRLPWDWTQLRDKVFSQAVAGTQFLEISVVDTSAEQARIIADEVANQLILQSPSAADPQKDAERQFGLSQIEDLKTNIRTAQEQSRQLDEIITKASSARQIQDARSQQAALQVQISSWRATYAQLLLSLQTSTPNVLSVVEPAQTPTQPIGPRVNENVMLAAMIGLVLAGSAAFLLEYLDDTLKTSDDVRQFLSLAVLAGIARINGKESPDRLITARMPRSPISEAYRMLRTNLQFSAIERPMRTLMVTSSSPLEGKSVTVANLSVVLAQSGKRVVLIDADMRRPTQHHIFDVGNSAGLTTVLLNAEMDLDYVLQPTPVENLRLMTSGPLPPNPSDLLGSKRMAILIDTLLQHNDMVVFDTPPVVAMADATILATRVDGTILVVDSGKTRRALARRSKDALDTVGAYIAGVVLNRQSGGGEGYYHYYAEDHRGSPAGLRASLRRIFGRRRKAEPWQQPRMAEVTLMTSDVPATNGHQKVKSRD